MTDASGPSQFLLARGVQKLRAKAAPLSRLLRRSRARTRVSTLRAAHAGASCESATRSHVSSTSWNAGVLTLRRTDYGASTVLARRVLSAQFVTHQP